MRLIRKFLNLLKLTAAFEFGHKHAKYVLGHEKLHHLVAGIAGTTVIVIAIAVGCGQKNPITGSTTQPSTTDNGWIFVDGPVVALNKDLTRVPQLPQLIEFNSKLYVVWLENKSADTTFIQVPQVRVAVYNGDDKAPRWKFVDSNGITGLNYDGTKGISGGSQPSAIVLNSKLYIGWIEGSNNNHSSVRVVVYNGNDDAPAWRFIDGNGSIGLTKDPNNHVGYVHLAGLAGKLYLTFIQGVPTVGYSSDTQLRVMSYNPDDPTPVWKFVDGDHLTRGLNWDTANNNVEGTQLFVFNSKLYISWSEAREAQQNQPFQMRAAVYNGNDNAPAWKFIDGNSSTGLNYDTSKDASSGRFGTLNGQLYLAFTQSTAGNTYGGRLIVYNGDDNSPHWSSADGNSPNVLVRDPKNRGSISSVVTHDARLFIALPEYTTTNIAGEARVWSFKGDGKTPFFESADGGGVYALNKDILRDAGAMSLASFNSKLYGAWTETAPGSTTWLHVAVKKNTPRLPKVVFFDVQLSNVGGYRASLNDEKMFAVAIALNSQTNFCSAGLGILFGKYFVPPGTKIAIHSNNAGQPSDVPLFESTAVAENNRVDIGENALTGGLAGEFCDDNTPYRSLPQGTYWIVAKFSSVPNTCDSDHCFNVVGHTSLPSSGLPIKVSSDGVNWTSRVFPVNGGGIIKQSLDAFLIY